MKSYDSEITKTVSSSSLSLYRTRSSITECNDGQTDAKPLVKEAYYLSIALRCCLIPSRKSSKYFIWLNNFICLNLIAVSIGTTLYVPITTAVTKEHDLSFQTILGLIWYIYCAITYTYLSNMAKGKRDIVELLQDVACREKDNRFAYPCSNEEPIRLILVICALAVLSNLFVSIMSVDVFERAIGVTHHTAFFAYINTCVVFLTCGWLLPVPIVYLGCRVLTRKINHLIGYVKLQFYAQKIDEESPLDLVFAMAWHDELYEKNCLLNDAISGLVTLSMGFFSLALICFALYFAVVGFRDNVTFWLAVCLFTLCMICFPAGELEIQNKLLSIEVGALPVTDTCAKSITFMQHYQTFATKCKRTEFGIYVFATKILITFNAMLRIGSTVLSGIIFLGGLVRAI